MLDLITSNLVGFRGEDIQRLCYRSSRGTRLGGRGKGRGGGHLEVLHMGADVSPRTLISPHVHGPKRMCREDQKHKYQAIDPG
jgi:hypothetical protein